MTQLARQFIDTSGAPLRVVTPKTSIGLVAPAGTLILAASGSTTIKHDARGVNPPVSTAWLIQAHSVFSYNIVANTTGGDDGATLKVELSPDGITFYDYAGYHIVGDNTPSTATGIDLPGHQARFTLINASTTATVTLSGWIKAQGF
jgi:hypothetical protein